MQSKVNTFLKTKILVVGILLIIFTGGQISFAADASEKQDYLRSAVFMGVLAHRGIEGALRQWTPTANYLTKNIDGYKFYIVPLDLNTISVALEEKRIDFLLTNPSSYSTLETQFGITRIVTLKKLEANHILSKFGAVIFSRADRKDINEINDLRGKSFMAVHEAAFGGWLMALKVFKSFGIKPTDDFSKLEFNGFPQDNIVLAVKDGAIDAGTVRTGILERMALADKVKMSDFRILNQQRNLNPVRVTVALD